MAVGLQLKFVPVIATLAVEPSIGRTMGSPTYLDHFEELTRVRTRLAEFKLSVEALDEDEVREQDQQGVAFARESLMDAVETLLAVLH